MAKKAKKATTSSTKVARNLKQLIAQSAKISAKVVIGAGVQIWESAVVGKEAVLGDKSVMDRRSYLGDRSVLCNDARICTYASVDNDCYIGSQTAINMKSVVGKNTSIGSFVIVEVDVVVGGNCFVGADTTIGRGSTIGDYIQIGNGVTFGQNCTIGETPTALLAPSRTRISPKITDSGSPANLEDKNFDLIIGNDCTFGRNVVIGPEVEVLPDGFRLDDNVTLLHQPVFVRFNDVLVQATAPGIIRIGCASYPITAWPHVAKDVAKQNALTEVEFAVFAKAYDLVRLWAEIYMPAGV